MSCKTRYARCAMSNGRVCFQLSSSAVAIADPGAASAARNAAKAQGCGRTKSPRYFTGGFGGSRLFNRGATVSNLVCFCRNFGDRGLPPFFAFGIVGLHLFHRGSAIDEKWFCCARQHALSTGLRSRLWQPGLAMRAGIPEATQRAWLIIERDWTRMAEREELNDGAFRQVQAALRELAVELRASRALALDPAHRRRIADPVSSRAVWSRSLPSVRRISFSDQRGGRGYGKYWRSGSSGHVSRRV